MAEQDIQTYRVGNLVIKIDRSKCISCASCTAIAPQTFELDEDLTSKVKDQGPYDDEETIKQAVAGCVSEAITIEVVDK